jgi:hypothetical protein
MERHFHRFSELFLQLGLPGEPERIGEFIRTHRPLAEGLPLEDAPFWTAAQAMLLREELLRDADWAEVVDQLSLALRG